ncbi:hypothetical protein J6590_097808 [Homalodisca vitripennis]|nr:hypothetical protein J6590_097808 [Homalodisca vitripennis]
MKLKVDLKVKYKKRRADIKTDLKPDLCTISLYLIAYLSLCWLNWKFCPVSLVY